MTDWRRKVRLARGCKERLRVTAAITGMDNLPDDALTAVLNTYPSTAELYENMHYELSGLSRSSLEHAVSAEMMTTQLLGKLSLPPRPQRS